MSTPPLAVPPAVLGDQRDRGRAGRVGRRGVAEGPVGGDGRPGAEERGVGVGGDAEGQGLRGFIGRARR